MSKKPQKIKRLHHILVASGVVVIGAILFVLVPHFASSTYTNPSAMVGDIVESITPPKPDVIHLETPDPLKAIYMSQCVAGTPSFRDNLTSLIEDTELNAVVIDIKDYTGKIAFPTSNQMLAHSVSKDCGARDMKSFVKSLNEKGIYVIGRITVFQDPYYSSIHPELAVKKESDGSVWRDYKGLSFIDVGARAYWSYIVELSKESYKIGFDELNYDYVRYPSDGNMKDIAFTHSVGKAKHETLEEFFAYLYDELKDTGVVLSVDLFGYTTTNTDDLGIGQVIERSLPYFDYVMPMVYPSHYNNGFIGLSKPATYPYEVVKYSMDSAVRRTQAIEEAKGSTSTSTDIVALKAIAEKGHGRINPDQLRPWLQDFDLGAVYTPDMVRAQMRATYDAGLTSWALWDAGNTYTRAALLSEHDTSTTTTER